MAKTQYETRAVLAAAYPGGRNSNPFTSLTHTLDTSTDTVLCGRVKVQSLADRFAANTTAPPTCERCFRYDPRHDQARIDAEVCRICGERYDEHDGREQHRFVGTGQYRLNVR